ncbi:lasso peptide biosynthesis B2 protein [Sphingomonas sp. SRS2]|uniref:lasso peptide biosynthesis B2 protein n=1 Tax=Sphingomonas sp. SRS2 TaxID=133190 RepID=UPI0006184A0D|nr:lasso peptide biosynthesis B2 protein [Sphingomonas sp. SRS2]KKC27757.1 hypothetical protein WP12_00785 [Sphingomonas sp. SRS2]
MFRLRRRMALGWRHGRLLLHCLLVVVLVRFGLTMVGYQPLLRRIALAGRSRRSATNVPLMMWAIRHAARLVPAATCLTQALAGHYLCHRAGHLTVVRIGVQRRDDGSVAAHAWLIDDDHVLIGGQEEDLDRFTTLIDLQGAAR